MPSNEFLVKGYYRNYDGMHLLKHALHNTCPDMMKSIGRDEHGNDIKVRDSEGIQLANAKIDEIRNGFSEWLEEQSPQFKERLTTMYNRKFNCFVRPKYDGSHQTFPDLNLKGLASRGVKSIYPTVPEFLTGFASFTGLVTVVVPAVVGFIASKLSNPMNKCRILPRY